MKKKKPVKKRKSMDEEHNERVRVHEAIKAKERALLKW